MLGDVYMIHDGISDHTFPFVDAHVARFPVYHRKSKSPCDGWKDVLLRGNGGRSFSQEGLCIAAEPSQFRCAAERGQNREISSNLFNL